MADLRGRVWAKGRLTNPAADRGNIDDGTPTGALIIAMIAFHQASSMLQHERVSLHVHAEHPVPICSSTSA